MSTVSIVGYEQIGVCEHCGRSLKDCIRISGSALGRSEMGVQKLILYKGGSIYGADTTLKAGDLKFAPFQDDGRQVSLSDFIPISQAEYDETVFDMQWLDGDWVQ